MEVVAINVKPEKPARGVTKSNPELERLLRELREIVDHDFGGLL